MRISFSALSVFLLLTGCASRSVLQNNAFTSALNLYNRNFVVAAPTFAGNMICGTPAYLLLTLYESTIGLPDPSEAALNVANAFVMTPGMICGALLGTVFVPLSFVCPENPWYFDWTNELRPWTCSPPPQKI